MSTSFALVVGWSLATLVLAYGYFRRYRMARPPIGVIGWTDVALILATVMAAPLVYESLPAWAALLLLVPSAIGISYFTLTPVVRAGWIAAAGALLLVAADVAAAAIYRTADGRFVTINDVLVVVLVVGVSNIWIQGGMAARHITVVAGVFAVYDLVATSRLPLMTDLLFHLSQLPVAPFLAWNADTRSLGIGIGDLVVTATFALAMRKAYGAWAGALAIGCGIAGIAAALALVDHQVARLLPAMVILGPSMALQYAAWSALRGPERTMRQYWDAEPAL